MMRWGAIGENKRGRGHRYPSAGDRAQAPSTRALQVEVACLSKYVRPRSVLCRVPVYKWAMKAANPASEGARTNKHAHERAIARTRGARAAHRTRRYGWYTAVSHGRGRTVEAWQGRVRVRLRQQP